MSTPPPLRWCLSFTFLSHYLCVKYVYLVWKTFTNLLSPSFRHPFKLEVLGVSGEGDDENEIYSLFYAFSHLIFSVCITLDTRNKHFGWYSKHGHWWTREKEEETWEIATINKKTSKTGFLKKKKPWENTFKPRKCVIQFVTFKYIVMVLKICIFIELFVDCVWPIMLATLFLDWTELFMHKNSIEYPSLK